MASWSIRWIVRYDQVGPPVNQMTWLPSPAIVSASRPAVRFGQVRSLDGIDLAIRPGEVVALAGEILGMPQTSLWIEQDGRLVLRAEHGHTPEQAAGLERRSFPIDAVAPDGVIEGIEAPAHRFCLGVQWHPEYAIDPGDSAIFRAFIDAARPR